jgi:hypothetical protein
VLEAVKARPGNVEVCLYGGATADLDSFCARRRPKSTVGAEESLRRGRTKESVKSSKQGRKSPQKSGLTVPRSYNPHSARTAAGCPTPAISCLGAFWTPASSVCRASRRAGVQKPAQCTIGDISRRNGQRPYVDRTPTPRTLGRPELARPDPPPGRFMPVLATHTTIRKARPACAVDRDQRV